MYLANAALCGHLNAWYHSSMQFGVVWFVKVVLALLFPCSNAYSSLFKWMGCHNRNTCSRVNWALEGVPVVYLTLGSMTLLKCAAGRAMNLAIAKSKILHKSVKYHTEPVHRNLLKIDDSLTGTATIWIFMLIWVCTRVEGWMGSPGYNLSAPWAIIPYLYTSTLLDVPIWTANVPVRLSDFQQVSVHGCMLFWAHKQMPLHRCLETLRTPAIQPAMSCSAHFA